MYLMLGEESFSGGGGVLLSGGHGVGMKVGRQIHWGCSAVIARGLRGGRVRGVGFIYVRVSLF